MALVSWLYSIYCNIEITLKLRIAHFSFFKSGHPPTPPPNSFSCAFKKQICFLLGG